MKPVRGGAAFWFNLKRSGKTDPITLHGACPVLLGHKWGKISLTSFFLSNLYSDSKTIFPFNLVSNKWIRETAQTFNRRCTLDVNE